MSTEHIITVEIETQMSIIHDTFVTKISSANLAMDNTQLWAEWEFAKGDGRVSRYVKYEEDASVNCVTLTANDPLIEKLTVREFNNQLDKEGTT